MATSDHPPAKKLKTHDSELQTAAAAAPAPPPQPPRPSKLKLTTRRATLKEQGEWVARKFQSFLRSVDSDLDLLRDENDRLIAEHAAQVDEIEHLKAENVAQADELSAGIKMQREAESSRWNKVYQEDVGNLRAHLLATETRVQELDSAISDAISEKAVLQNRVRACDQEIGEKTKIIDSYLVKLRQAEKEQKEARLVSETNRQVADTARLLFKAHPAGNWAEIGRQMEELSKLVGGECS